MVQDRDEKARDSQREAEERAEQIHEAVKRDADDVSQEELEATEALLNRAAFQAMRERVETLEKTSSALELQDAKDGKSFRDIHKDAVALRNEMVKGNIQTNVGLLDTIRRDREDLQKALTANWGDTLRELDMVRAVIRENHRTDKILRKNTQASLKSLEEQQAGAFSDRVNLRDKIKVTSSQLDDHEVAISQSIDDLKRLGKTQETAKEIHEAAFLDTNTQLRQHRVLIATLNTQQAADRALFDTLSTDIPMALRAIHDRLAELENAPTRIQMSIHKDALDLHDEALKQHGDELKDLKKETKWLDAEADRVRGQLSGDRTTTGPEQWNLRCHLEGMTRNIAALQTRMARCEHLTEPLAAPTVCDNSGFIDGIRPADTNLAFEDIPDNGLPEWATAALAEVRGDLCRLLDKGYRTSPKAVRDALSSIIGKMDKVVKL
jgi:hypothetical protein